MPPNFFWQKIALLQLLQRIFRQNLGLICATELWSQTKNYKRKYCNKNKYCTREYRSNFQSNLFHFQLNCFHFHLKKQQRQQQKRQLVPPGLMLQLKPQNQKKEEHNRKPINRPGKSGIQVSKSRGGGEGSGV